MKGEKKSFSSFKCCRCTPRGASLSRTRTGESPSMRLTYIRVGLWSSTLLMLMDCLAGLREFFSGRPWDASLLPSVLLSLQNVLSWFYSQRLFHFYASSLLFVYETHSDMPANVDLRLIGNSFIQ